MPVEVTVVEPVGVEETADVIDELVALELVVSLGVQRAAGSVKGVPEDG